MAIIEFINGKNRTLSGMKRSINYILRPDKTKEGLYGGKECDPNSAYENFVLIKRAFNKETGRQFIHFVQSFSDKENVSEETVKEIADKLVLYEKFLGFQIVYAVHTDTDNLHSHFILNTVNSITGEKFRISKEELLELKDYSDKLCSEAGLSVTHGKKGAYINRGTYRTKEKGHSWKYETYLAVKTAKKYAISKDDFIQKLNKLGYEVNWQETRKYITFTNPEGKKVRNKKLYPPEAFTKEAFEKQFELNIRNLEKARLNQEFEVVLSAVKLLEINDGNNTTRNVYPLSNLEGSRKKDLIAEIKKGDGLDWKNEVSYEQEL